MNIVQILLIIILTIGYYLFFQYENKKIRVRLFLLMAYGTILIFIISPESADKVAHMLHVTSGIDMVIYLSIAGVWLLAVMNFVHNKHLERAVTKMVRKNALDILCYKLRQMDKIDDFK